MHRTGWKSLLRGNHGMRYIARRGHFGPDAKDATEELDEETRLVGIGVLIIAAIAAVIYGGWKLFEFLF